MGDWCYLEITMRKADLPKFALHLHEPPDKPWWDDEKKDNPPGLATVRVFEANYAWYDEREAAAKAGLPFYGKHGEGGEYGPYAFASSDGGMLETPLDRDGELTMAVDEDLQPLGDIERLRAFVAKRRAVQKGFENREVQEG